MLQWDIWAAQICLEVGGGMGGDNYWAKRKDSVSGKSGGGVGYDQNISEILKRVFSN